MRLIDELVSREYLLDIVGKMPSAWEYGQAVSDIYNIIKDAPTIEAEPVWHGQWLNVDINWERGYTIAQCSECGEKIEVYKAIEKIKFCPNCGTKMDGGTEDA